MTIWKEDKVPKAKCIHKERAGKVGMATDGNILAKHNRNGEFRYGDLDDRVNDIYCFVDVGFFLKDSTSSLSSFSFSNGGIVLYFPW